jgi:serine/threonine protein phosphatase PrpC
MPFSRLLATVAPTAVAGRPKDEELDLFGLTHPGRVRKENQDHFLLCTLHQQIVVHGTSLPGPEHLPLRGERMGTILLVADGVGGSSAGGEASQLATEAVTSYVTSTMRCFHATDASEEKIFCNALKSAVLDAHDAVRKQAAWEKLKMATTMTLAIAVWPRLYVVQVGDSRCYLYWDGKLRQVTRDQTVAQYLVDTGAMPPEQAARSPFNNVLSSSVGGEEAKPEVAVVDITPRGCVVVVCSDGLTKHVRDDEIAEQLRTMSSSEQAATNLLNLALERGGSDNITIIVARARP